MREVRLNTDDWSIQMVMQGGGSTLYLDNYYEYITGPDGSVSPDGVSTVYGYTDPTDALKHPSDTTVTAPNGDTTTTEHSMTPSVTIGAHSHHAMQFVTDPSGQKTSYLHNPLGQLARVREHTAAGLGYADTEYEYEKFGNLEYVTRKNSGGTQLIKQNPDGV